MGSKARRLSHTEQKPRPQRGHRPQPADQVLQSCTLEVPLRFLLQPRLPSAFDTHSREANRRTVEKEANAGLRWREEAVTDSTVHASIVTIVWHKVRFWLRVGLFSERRGECLENAGC